MAQPRLRTAPAACGPAPLVPTVRAVARVIPPAPTVHRRAPVDVAPAPATYRSVWAAGTSGWEREDGGTGQAGLPQTSDGSRALVRRNGWQPRRAVLPVVVAILAAFAAATCYLAVVQPRSDGDVGRWTTAGTVAEAVPGRNPFGTAAPALAGVPTRLRIPAISVDTALESLHLDTADVLTPPTDFTEAGWYADGTAPGDPGPAVIAGHVDSRRGPAVFYRLRELTPGDRIDVVRDGRTVRFTVVSSAWYPKNAFPTDQVYGPTPDRQLRLITCGGVFDHQLRSYRDNLVVYAVAG